MTATIVLEHVRTYATAVRAHLADLTAEQVDELTDGLEADLADALADGAPVPGGEPAADGADESPAGSSLLDLERRFGPPADYAAELRTAAGLPPARAGLRARGVRALVGRTRADLRAWAVRWNLPTLAEPFRPVWWVVRAWAWFVLLGGSLVAPEHNVERFVPVLPTSWVLLAACLVVSAQVGRGRLPRHRWWARAAVAASVVAALTLPWATTELRRNLDQALAGPVYVEVPVEVPVAERVEAGVWVDGMAVSNLFVYDAEGNPLEGVQVFDDRGRQVRTVEDSWSEWSLPGVDQWWHFAPVTDVDGRERWNVYPLRGAPVELWEEDEHGAYVLGEDLLQTPPRPFPQAAAVAAE